LGPHAAWHWRFPIRGLRILCRLDRVAPMVEPTSDRWEDMGIWSDLGVDRYHSVRFGSVQRIFGTWFQAAAQDKKKQAGKI